MTSTLRQKADLTHKHNLKTGRHGWLRLTPAYSVKIVEELLCQDKAPLCILDPFAGTGTTALCAAYRGHDAVTIDINPFLIWLGRAKLAHYSSEDIASTLDVCSEVSRLVREEQIEPAPIPTIYNVDRWWSASSLLFLRRLLATIEFATLPDSTERSLLLVAFCRSLIARSSAAFNHQSMSFKHANQLSIPLDIDLIELFAVDLQFVLEGAADNPSGRGEVRFGDARDLPAVVEGRFDRVITSPPYANRMSYVRELRPYMYWLGFFTDGRAAGELDWSAIGGTWGIATSRLAEWKRPTDRFIDEHLDDALQRIHSDANKSGKVLANYVAKYFDDMWTHFQGMRSMLVPGAEVHYIVGNSTFYGVLLSTEKLYAEMLRRLGFENIVCRPIRKRNSKMELIEFDVSARWPG